MTYQVFGKEWKLKEDVSNRMRREVSTLVKGSDDEIVWIDHFETVNQIMRRVLSGDHGELDWNEAPTKVITQIAADFFTSLMPKTSE